MGHSLHGFVLALADCLHLSNNRLILCAGAEFLRMFHRSSDTKSAIFIAVLVAVFGSLSQLRRDECLAKKVALSSDWLSIRNQTSPAENTISIYSVILIS